MNRPESDNPTPESISTTDRNDAKASPMPEGQAVAAPPAESKELSGHLAGLTLPKQVLVLAIWPFLEQLLNFMVGMVDTYLAGHLSVEATNAIAPASYIGWLMGLLQMSVGIGAAAVIARAVGGKHRRVANAALGQAMLLSIFVGIATGGLIYLLAPSVTKLIGITGPGFDMAVGYLRIMALGGPFCSIMLVGAACLRAAGDTKSPFIVLAIINVVNVVVSSMLVYGPQPFGGHGVEGIAWGTAAAWFVGSILIMMFLIRDWGGIRLRWMRMRPHWHTMRRIVRVAVSSLFESIGMWGGNFTVLVWVGQLGEQNSAVWGSHMIAIRVEAISYLPCFALAIAASTLTGQYLGLGDPERAKQAGRLCWGWGALIMGLAGASFLLFPYAWCSIVTNQQPLLDTAPHLLWVCGWVQVFLATAIVLSGAMRGAGDTRTTMILTYITIYGIRLPMAYLFGIVLGYGINGIWYGLCIELFIRGFIFGGRYLHGGWAKVKV